MDTRGVAVLGSGLSIERRSTSPAASIDVPAAVSRVAPGAGQQGRTAGTPGEGDSVEPARDTFELLQRREAVR
jgi:hypothetical protein